MNVLFWERLLTVLKAVNHKDGKCSYLSMYFGQFRYLIHKNFSVFAMERMTYYI